MKYIVGAFLIFVVLIFGLLWYSAASTGNSLENAITAQYEQNQNSLSNMSNSIAEAAQVPTMARDDLIAVIKSGIEGRYGPNGSGALVQAMKESYPGQLDPKLYLNLQTLIEAKRNDFANEQKILIDKIRSYKTALGSPIQGFFLSLAGYPKIDLEQYKIIKSDYTNDAFKTGLDKGLKLR